MPKYDIYLDGIYTITGTAIVTVEANHPADAMALAVAQAKAGEVDFEIDHHSLTDTPAEVVVFDAEELPDDAS